MSFGDLVRTIGQPKLVRLLQIANHDSKKTDISGRHLTITLIGTQHMDVHMTRKNADDVITYVRYQRYYLEPDQFEYAQSVLKED
jgi:hypothetical protein